MIQEDDLYQLQVGRAEPADARRAIRRALADAEPKVRERLYTALRGWTWRALHGRKLDASLQDWFEVLTSAQSNLAASDVELASRFSVLTDLLHESIRFAAANSDEMLLGLSHLGDILAVIRRHNDGADRAAIERETSLGTAHLSQLLTRLTTAGKLERTQLGKEAHFTLTEGGRELADKWVSRQLPHAATLRSARWLTRPGQRRIQRLIKDRLDEGATTVAGAGRQEDLGKGFYAKSVFANVTNDMTIAKGEIFDPVASIPVEYDIVDETAKFRNDAEYGLAASDLVTLAPVRAEAQDHLNKAYEKGLTANIHVNATAHGASATRDAVASPASFVAVRSTFEEAQRHGRELASHA